MFVLLNVLIASLQIFFLSELLLVALVLIQLDLNKICKSYLAKFLTHKSAFVFWKESKSYVKIIYEILKLSNSEKKCFAASRKKKHKKVAAATFNKQVSKN